MKLRCTFAPSTVLNTAIQKTSSVPILSFLLSSVFPPRSSWRLSSKWARVGAFNYVEIIKGTRKRIQSPSTFRYRRTGSPSCERHGCNFLSPLSVNNVYFLPVVSFFFLWEEERLCPGNLITRHIGAHERVSCFFLARSSFFLIMNHAKIFIRSEVSQFTNES